MKRIVSLLLALVFIVGLVSCKPGNASSSDSPESLPPSSSHISSLDPSSSDIQSSSRPSSSVSSSDEESNAIVSSNGYYCYSFLSDRQKEYYTRMATAVSELDSHWIILGDADETYQSDIAVAREALSVDRPDIFWMPAHFSTAKTTDGKAAIRFSRDADTGEDSEDSPAYLISRAEKLSAAEKLNDAVAKIVSQITATEPYEIELQLHDILCQHITYSANKADPMVYTAYGALVDGQALCEGYSRAMQLLLRHFGISSTLVTGTARGEGHMWNLVNLGGEWYHLDVTWDDLSSVSHEYFNLSDEQVLLDHAISGNHTVLSSSALASGVTSFNIGVPSCAASAQNYFIRTGFTYHKDSPEGLLDLMASTADTMVEVRFATIEERNLFADSAAQTIEALNTLLTERHPTATFYIGGYSVSTSVLRLYKTEYNKTTD